MPPVRCAEMLAVASCSERRCALACTTRETGAPASSGPNSSVLIDKRLRSVCGIEMGPLGFSSGLGIGGRSMCNSPTSRLFTSTCRVRSAEGDQRSEMCSANSHTPRSSLSCRRPRSSAAGKDPLMPDNCTCPSVRRAVVRTMKARPLSVLPTISTAQTSATSSRPVRPRSRRRFSVRDASARRLVPIRCRSRTHHQCNGP